MKERIENKIVDLVSKELRQFKDELQNLPEVTLNKLELDATWDEIRTGVAESKSSISYKSSAWAWMSVAACMALLTVLFLNSHQAVMKDSLLADTEAPVSNTRLATGQAVETGLISDILALKQFNRTIENRLDALPEQPRLVRANTMDTITRLEDQIAFLDYRIDMQEHEPLNEEEYRGLWQQRVKSMNGLYQVRAAQVQGTQQQPRFERVAYYD